MITYNINWDLVFSGVRSAPHLMIKQAAEVGRIVFFFTPRIGTEV